MIGMSDEAKARVTPDMSVRAINRLRKEGQAKALPAPSATTEAVAVDNADEADTTVAATVHISNDTSGIKQELPKQVDTLLVFGSYTDYQKELERIDTLVERAFKRSKQPITVKIICEQI